MPPGEVAQEIACAASSRHFAVLYDTAANKDVYPGRGRQASTGAGGGGVGGVSMRQEDRYNWMLWQVLEDNRVPWAT